MRNIQTITECTFGGVVHPANSFVSVDDQDACSAIACGAAVPFIGEMPAVPAVELVAEQPAE